MGSISHKRINNANILSTAKNRKNSPFSWNTLYDDSNKGILENPSIRVSLVNPTKARGKKQLYSLNERGVEICWDFSFAIFWPFCPPY